MRSIDRARARQHPDILLVERLLPLLGILQLRATLGELCVEELERTLRLGDAAGGVAGKEQVDQLADHRLRQPRVLRVREAAARQVRADLEEIVLRALDADRLLQPGDHDCHVARGRGLTVEVCRLTTPVRLSAESSVWRTVSMSCCWSLLLMPTACGRIDCGCDVDARRASHRCWGSATPTASRAARSPTPLPAPASGDARRRGSRSAPLREWPSSCSAPAPGFPAIRTCSRG